jgi:alpha-glucosidase
MIVGAPDSSAFAWWQRGVVYQIYPRSFQDSNGDGIGDLRGICARLDYLANLGVDAIWLSPVYPSPMDDFGYDVSNFVDIDPIFGTLADFEILLAAAHERGLKVIMDLVPNHTSNRHPWFLESRSSRENSKRDWYIWRDGHNDGPPNNWLSEFGGPAWTFDSTTGQYYYHAYLSAQPDLNWRNPAVAEAIHAVMRFWLDLGVDGFRLDTIHHLIEDASLRDNPIDPDWRGSDPPTRRYLRAYTVDRPETQEVLRGFRCVTDRYVGRVLIGEAYLPLEALMAYYGTSEQVGLHLPFNFNLLQAPWDAAHIAGLVRRYETLLPPDAWPNWVLGNHDRPRLASRIGLAQAPVAAMLLLTLRGTPTLYYGDEIGMSDVAIPAGEVQDPYEKNVPGFGLGRDPVRTPMPWDGGPNGGFTAGRPWLRLGADAGTRNVAAQERDPASLLALYRALLSLRRAEPALSVGRYAYVQHRQGVLMYERGAASRRLLVCLNLSSAAASVPLTAPGRVILSTSLARKDEDVANVLELAANEGVIISPAQDAAR